MSEIFVTSDTHFLHNKPFLYEPRGFASTEEMSEAIVKRWNSVVKSEDTVYHLGDICLSDTNGAIPYIQSLNGNIIWIRGNHCTDNRIDTILSTCSNIHLIGTKETSWAYMLKSGKWSFYLSHYPTITSNNEDWKKLFCLCGHSHTKDKWADWDKACYHVEMDAHDCYPVSLEQIKDDIRKKRLEKMP